MTATEAYRLARDQLLSLRGAQARATAEFRWPMLGMRFNWAVDWLTPSPEAMPAPHWSSSKRTARSPSAPSTSWRGARTKARPGWPPAG